MAEGRSKSASGKGLANSNLPEKNDAVKSSLKDDQKTLARPRLQILLGYLKLNALLVLGAAISEASKLNLSPVYGSIPSSRNHFTLVTTLYAAGGIAALQWPMSRLWRLELLPVLAYWIPVTQHFLFGYSQTFRASHGPWVTEILSIGPLLFLLGACSLQFKNTNGGRWTTIAERGVAQVTFVWSMSYAESFMTSRIGQSLSYTRIAYLIEIAMGFTATAPSKLLFLVIPALLHTAILNPHVQTPSATTSLETSLRYQNFTLLARQESLTGYISVLETTSDTEYNYRVMRCDHSLLGGEWVMPQGEAKVPEPIYSIFTMLQAVRLVKSPIITGLPADEKNALVM